jgi:Homeodomain-like domain
MNKKYVLMLTVEERGELETVANKGADQAVRRRRARALLLIDQGDEGPAWRDEDVAEAVGVTSRSIENCRKRACEEGPLESLSHRPQKRKIEPLIDGEVEAELVKLACSTPPAGRSRWSPRLLAGQPVELEIVGSVCHETVRRALKKTTSNRGRRSIGASLPRRMRRLWPTWSGCSTCTSARMIRGIRWSAWTSSPNNSSKNDVPPCPPVPARPARPRICPSRLLLRVDVR